MEYGLSTSTAHQTLQRVGKNLILTKTSHTAFSLFFSQFPSFINGILLTAAAISFFVGDSIDGFFILLIIFLNSLFGFVQEYRAEKSLEKLKDYASPTARVFRDGKEREISAADIVPDDLMILSEGERIPADGVLTQAHDLEIDESVLTGESLPVAKEKQEFVYLGTLIIKGRGMCKVNATGMQTKFGQIAQTLATIKTDKTPLQKQLGSLGKTLSVIAVLSALLLIPIGLFQQRELAPLLLLAISVSVAAIPEGLPAVITIALAIGTNRMAKQKAIVRKMPTIETLGSMQIVLVDKTGTLTQNVMKVKKTWLSDGQPLNHLLFSCRLGNTASLIQKSATNSFDVVGDRTDGALLMYALNQNSKLDEDIKKGKVIDEHVFDSRTKTITTVWEHSSKKYVFVRGAPEAVLAKSRISKADEKKVNEIIQEYAKESLRIIGFASKVETHNGDLSREHLEKDLTFLGIVGIYDAPRPEVKDAVHQAKQAGIHTIMVTGDNEITALAIAKEIGLIEKNEDVITGDELDKMSDEELTSVMTKTRIFARTKPEDKLRLVTLLKQQGFVIGVTGDGVNDALALKKADVGIAMGESGTDVAKEASDIILTDDNFSTLIHAVEEGRTIYHNILKSITYLLSGNIAEISTVFFALVLGMPTPFFPTQILWINLVTDGLPALALASDIKTHNVLNHSPRNSKTSILTKKRLFFIAVVGLSLG